MLIKKTSSFPFALTLPRNWRARGVDASKAVFVGDMVDLDIAGPQSVGMKIILIKRRRSGKDSGARPDVVIRSLTELLRVIEGC